MLGFSAVALAATLQASPEPKAFDAWGSFKQRYVTSDGRVIDTGNKAISHSEGQGAGMLLATHFRDRAAFTSLWTWTKAHLQIRQDALFAWKWTPEAGAEDPNNATDGDLLIAWALSRAAERWSEPQWREESRKITRDVLGKLVKQSGGHTVLLPGAYGFEGPEGAVINLSYWIFPAFEHFQRRDSRPEWGQLKASGHALLREARFGRWGLPPDWLVMKTPLAPAPGFKPRFGYNAIRIPLYLLWAGEAPKDLMTPFQSYWGTFRTGPLLSAWTDLVEDSIDSYPASPGIQAIARATMTYPTPSKAPLTALSPDYYSATLQLFMQAVGDPSW
jgi:endo-1,4-beta-D-glucanase Y